MCITPEQRTHLDAKISEAVAIVREALDVHLDGHELAGRVVLYSGGNDSTTLAHLLLHNFPEDLRATHAGHANTTIGVERTRQFVRDTCAAWGLPLLEKLPPKSYAELVTEPDGQGRLHGFPGPAKHFKMYQRLKERCLEQIRNELVGNPRQRRVLFIAGRRRSESERRANIPIHERKGSVIWASPLADWTKDDLNLYRGVYGVPRNPVADDLGMSGECLCGAFAEPGEFERIAEIDPDSARQILDIEEAARAAGVPEQQCRWGWGAYRADPDGQPIKTGALCSSCDARYQGGPSIIPEEQQSPSLKAALAKRQARLARRGEQMDLFPAEVTA